MGNEQNSTQKKKSEKTENNEIDEELKKKS